MAGICTDAFEGVVHKFFEAAALPSLWPDALHALALACGAEGAAAHSASGVKTFGTVASEGSLKLYHDFVTRWRAPELNSHRARGLALIQGGWRGVLTEQDCFTPQELARDPFHQEFIVPAGFPSFAGVMLAKGPGLMLSASIYRRPDQGPYQRDEIAQINKLVGYLRGASALALRVGTASNQRLTEALGSAGHPVALIGRDGCVIYMNERLERLIGDGVLIRAGRLGSWHAVTDRALAAAIHAVVRHDGVLHEPFGSLVLPKQTGLRGLVARIIPVVGLAHDILHRVSAIVTFSDLGAAPASPSERLLAQAFAFTPAEARLARKIATGKTLSEIARTEKVSRETLRSRLKAIFDKTGTGRQAELALLMARVANLGS
jgi:DNA-binding CsgD family transcriptional regulator/PAS domain-containing protein